MKIAPKYINIIKNILFGIFIFLLTIPMIQQSSKYFESRPLKGSFSTKSNPDFTVSKWYEGKYQKPKQEYLNENFGFRNFFVRLNNQLYFKFFNQAKANGIIIGEDNYLFGEMYINAYLGNDFIGYDTINKKVNKLVKIVDTLKTQGIDLVVLLAPGKGSYYPKFFPKKYINIERTTTNYDVYKEKLIENRINLLDFYTWFNEMKDTTTYPLFPKTGIHWSKYGEIIAEDSIIRYISQLRKDKRIPKLKINKINQSKVMRSTDEDIEQGMNLLFPIEDLEMGYPSFSLKRDSLDFPPTVLTIADSYFWGMYNWGISHEAFNDGQFWFYNKNIHPRKGKKIIKVQDINIQEEVLKNDVILLLSTDANLKTFAFGFIDELYASFYKDIEK